MVTTQGKLQELADHHLPSLCYWCRCYFAHSQDAAIRRVDNSCELINVHHAQVGYSERIAREFKWLKLLIAGLVDKHACVFGNLRQRLVVRTLYHRYYKPFIHRDSGTNIDLVILANGFARPR